ncbi:MAG: hypothetical protein ACTHJT_12625 [Cytophaga sp.]|uniref:hypothetical protein n=1 Tax=Cytophaga sp. TaxID=29535 RepID=UPI003F7FF5ED
MIFDDKYILNQNFLELEVLELLDFTDLPILNLEIDNAGTKFLSYLDVFITDDIEQRLIIAISDTRLNSFMNGEINLHDIFNTSENRVVYVAQYNINDNETVKSYLIPIDDFIPINPIKKSYTVEFTQEIASTSEQLVALYATQRAKVILELYVQSDKLKTSLKPWVFDKFLNPIQNIIADLLDINYKTLNEKVAYANPAVSSFKISVEINVQSTLLNIYEDIPEYKKLLTVIELLNSESKQDLEKIFEGFKDDKFIKSYIQIVKTIIANDASVHATLANPASKETSTADLSKSKAEKIKKVIDEQLPERTDIEETEGVFLKLDFNVNPPSFTIENNEEYIFKGKIDAAIIETLKSDKVNFSTDKYLFTITTVYKPETTVSAEQIHHFLTNYKLLT